MGLITSNLWLVLSSFVHCVSVVPFAMYFQIEWCISQPQLALAFRLAPLRVLNDWNFHVIPVMAFSQYSTYNKTFSGAQSDVTYTYGSYVF